MRRWDWLDASAIQISRERANYSRYAVTMLAGKMDSVSVKRNGGRGGIRTPGTLAGTLVFKTSAIDHSATLPFFELCRNFQKIVNIALLIALFDNR